MLRARLDILLSIPGIGAVTALALMVDMPELGTMDAKQAASLAGLAPVTRQSGTWRGKSFIQGGRATLRQALYMPALVAIRFNPPMKRSMTRFARSESPPTRGDAQADHHRQRIDPRQSRLDTGSDRPAT